MKKPNLAPPTPCENKKGFSLDFPAENLLSGSRLGRRNNTFFYLTCWLAFAASGLQARVSFTAPTFSINAEAEHPEYYDLSLFLSDTGGENLHWTLVGRRPAFLELDPTGVLHATPGKADRGLHRLRLAVRGESDGGASALVEFTVK
jgi:hypothetical protein